MDKETGEKEFVTNDREMVINSAHCNKGHAAVYQCEVGCLKYKIRSSSLRIRL